MNEPLITWMMITAAIVWGIYFLMKKIPPQKKLHSSEEIDIPREVDFLVNFYTSKGWYGTFVDGEVVKNGVATNLDKDSVKKGDIIRGITSGMAEGLWQIQVIMLDVPKETVVPTYKDRRGRWRCIYPNENGVAMTGIILHSPRMLVEELVIGRPYPAHRCNDNFFELE